MANYSVDIAIAVKGAKELKAVRAETTALSKEITTLNRLANKQSKTLPNSFNTLNKVLGQAKGNLNKVALGTDRYFRAISDVIDKEERLSKAYKKQKTDFKVIQRLRQKGLEINKQNIQLIRSEIAAELRLARAKGATAKASVRKGMSARIGSTASSAIIGGAFPLLFGQTGAAAVGGGLGGAAGGLIGGQFGFALSIAGTTIGNALDQLSKALVKPSENIEMLVNRLGLAGTETGDLALRLEKLGLESDAAELLVREFERTFGLTADEFKENAETLKNFNNEINKLGTSLTLMMANVLNPLIKELNNLIAGKKPEGISRGITGTIDFFTANAFDLDKRGQLLDEIAPILNPTKPPKVSNIPAAEGNPNIPGIGQLNPDFGKPGFVTLPPVKDRLKPFKDKADQKFQREEILPLKQALEIEQKRLTTSSEKLTLMQEQFELTNLENELELLK